MMKSLLPWLAVLASLPLSIRADIGSPVNVGILEEKGHHPQIFLAGDQNSQSCIPSSTLPLSTFSHLAQYSPWFPAARYIPPAEGCSVDQVHLLHRHSSRFPTAGAGRIIQASLARLQSAIAQRGPTSNLSWLLDYSYDLGKDDLVPLGIKECVRFLHTLLYRFDSTKCALLGQIRSLCSVCI